jgi:hypothetical protein
MDLRRKIQVIDCFQEKARLRDDLFRSLAVAAVGGSESISSGSVR